MMGDSLFSRRDNTHIYIYIFKYFGLVNEFNPNVEKLNFDKMSNMINFRVFIRPKSMLSITLRKKCCIIKSDCSNYSKN